MRRTESREQVVEEAPEHTTKKRAILRDYMGAWLGILGRAPFPSLWWVDCFAGPGLGRDASRTTGALSVRMSQRLLESGGAQRVSCINVEMDSSYFDRLISVISDDGIPLENQINCPPLDRSEWFQQIAESVSPSGDVNVYNCNAAFQDVIDGIVHHLPNHSQPSFFFMDPWGWSHVPFATMRRVLARTKAEVFLTFFVKHIARFLESREHIPVISNVLGTEAFSEAIGAQGHEREEAILRIYKEQLHTIGGCFATEYRMIHTNIRQTAYYLLHVSKHPTAFETMKETMWRHGTPGRGACYAGPDHAHLSQTKPLFDPDTFELKQILSRDFAGRTLTHTELKKWVLWETRWVSTVLRDSLQELEQHEAIHVQADRNRRSGFQDTDLITFM